MASWVKNLYTNDRNDSSDDELPEVVSTMTMKSVREEEMMTVRDNKRRMQEVRKERKKLTMEKFLSEKKAKLKTSVIDGEGKDSGNNEYPTLKGADEKTESLEDNKSRKKYLKSYPKLNIKVQPLEKISTSRAKAAINFKTSRFAKVNREDVSKFITSYNEKQMVKNNKSAV